ncbi:mitochondrial import inner membrane translocase subunit TIM22, partial [Tanacetum coccineum]
FDDEAEVKLRDDLRVLWGRKGVGKYTILEGSTHAILGINKATQEELIMRQEKQSVLVVGNQKNPLATLKSNYKEFERLFKDWLVNDAFSSACAAFVSGAIPYAIGPDNELPYRLATIAAKRVSCNPLVPILPALIGGGRLDWARNMAVIGGVQRVMDCAMRRLRGQEDVPTSLVRSFTAGVVVSLVCGINGANVISNGVLFALIDVGACKIHGKSSYPVEHVYTKTSDMLSSLGLDEYEKNFKNGDLQEAKIPVGARRLILDHIKREEVTEKGGTRREI